METILQDIRYGFRMQRKSPGFAAVAVITLLFEVSSTDPITFSCVALLLCAVALLACYLPARCAAGVDSDGGSEARVRRE
jgi:hypothetical protein